MTQVEVTDRFVAAIVDGEFDRHKDTCYLRVSFRPAWMQPKVHVVFEAVRERDGMVCTRIETPPMNIDDTVSLGDAHKLFKISIDKK
jgi:hypothetical protein